ncbi:phage tail protein [Serratia fonticola]|uniref:phage tail protein n=1 Tax=Serratia fonticola TaxID=47917 RepID=UPI0015C62F31|nr:phage tail protein [Serratia fonticola]NYA15761.1 phage tail protein [Serratia fonticola]NYA35881.1 phage tail protein [Serratia fonticola]
MSYKNLLKKNTHATEIPALGQKVWVRRLSGEEIDNYDKAVAAEKAGANNENALIKLGIELFLSALMNEDGSKPTEKDLPTAAELLKVHSYGDLLKAYADVQRHSYGTLEIATKN